MATDCQTATQSRGGEHQNKEGSTLLKAKKEAVSHPERRPIRRVARRLLRMLIGSGSSLNQVFLGVLSIIPASF